MLKRLLKYEFLSTGRIFGLCYAGVLALALLFRITGALAWDHTAEHAAQHLVPWIDLLASLSGAIYGVMIAAVFVITFILILQRFYRNLLGGEGYLMNTLPVHAWQLVISKLIAATVWIILSCVVVALSVGLFAATGDMLSEIISGFRDLLAYFHQQFRLPFIVLVLETVAVCITWITASVLQIYASIMIGHQARRHKIALAVGAYFGINVVMTVAMSVLVNVANALPGNVLDALFGLLLNGTPMQSVQVVLIALVLIQLALSAVFFAVTEHMLRRNLNLE